MSRYDALDKEIEAMERMAFGNQSEEDSTEQEVVDENVDETQESAEEATIQESSEDSIEPTEDHEEHLQESDEDISQKKQRQDWKKRYKSYKASTDATIYSLRRENASLNEENLRLTKKVDELSYKLAEASTNSYNPLDSLTEEERELLGDETAGSVQKLIDAKVKNLIEPLQKKLDEEKEYRRRTQEEVIEERRNLANQSFFERLEDLVPDYESIDTNPKFLAFMKEVEEESGLTREYIFKHAQSIGDVNRVASYFKAFKSLMGEKKTNLDSKITPTKSGTGHTQIKNNRNQPITMNEILTFYDDCSRGKYKSQDKLRRELELKYDRALSSGQVS